MHGYNANVCECVVIMWMYVLMCLTVAYMNSALCVYMGVVCVGYDGDHCLHEQCIVVGQTRWTNGAQQPAAKQQKTHVNQTYFTNPSYS